MKQFFIPLRRNGKFYVKSETVFGTMMIATTLRRVWNKHIRKFCILWSVYFKIERRAKCKSQVKCWCLEIVDGWMPGFSSGQKWGFLKGPCPVMALSSILFIPTWQMLLNNNDELPLMRMGKGRCVALGSKHTGDGYQKKLHRDLL